MSEVKRRRNTEDVSASILDQFIREADGPLKCKRCDKELKVDKLSNLKRHLQIVHREDFEHIMSVAGEEDIAQSPRKIPTVSVAIDANFLKEACVKMVTIGGISFNVLDQPGLGDLLRTLEKALKIPQINRKNIGEHVKFVSQEFIKKITEELKGMFICLKLDSATRKGRCVIGITVQFVKNGVIVIRTLGVYELNISHTAEAIKAEIIKILAVYGVRMEQVYAITTDNGSNYVKAVRIIHNEQLTPVKINYELSDSEDERTNNSAEHDEEILDEGEIHVQAIQTALVRSVRCAAHTLQLAVYDALKQLKLRPALSSVRAVVKTLRTKRNRKLLERNNLPVPGLDCETRWNSSFQMIKYFKDYETKLHELSEEIEDTLLTEEDWEFVHQYFEAFLPVSKTTTKLQEENITMGDFFFLWLDCSLHLQELEESPIAQALAGAMKIRQKLLFDNEAFLAAAYVDPRINYEGSTLLTADEFSAGLARLTELWKHIKHKFEGVLVPSVDQSGQSTSAAPVSRVEAMLRKQHDVSTAKKLCIESKLKLLQVKQRMSVHENVLLYWQNFKTKEPEMYTLASIALSVPCTQVSVERAFSALGLILTDKRLRLCDENLQNLLLVKLNKDLFKTTKLIF